MSKPVVGVLVGTALGAIDGLSACFYPEARPMIVGIVIGSTLKGLVTGLLAGVIARWKHSISLGVIAGLIIGGVLSSVAAIGQADHYFQIVLPGMLVGALVGFVTQRYPQVAVSRGAVMVLLLVATVWNASLAAQAPPQSDPFVAIA